MNEEEKLRKENADLRIDLAIARGENNKLKRILEQIGEYAQDLKRKEATSGNQQT